MIQGLCIRAAVLAMKQLYGASQFIAMRIGARSYDHVEHINAPWCIALRSDDCLYGGEWKLYTQPDKASHDRVYSDSTHKYNGFYVHKPTKFGNIVIIRDFSPDGGGTTYVLDARDEVGSL